MSSQNLSITQTGAVARITLTQPEIRNAFSDEVIAEITAAFVDVGSRADVRAVVLAAEGPAFCAGADLNWMRRMADYTRDENIADAGKLAEMLRVGREAVVSFPNFGYWRHRQSILNGRMPVSETIPYAWYDTPNLHLCMLGDFEALCAKNGIRVVERVVMDGEQEITFLPNLLGSLALIGTPLFSGFYSKDSIIEAVHFSHLPAAGFAHFAVLAGVFVTAFYSFRMYFLVFHGKERFDQNPDAHHGDHHGHDDHHEPHESPWVVTVPLVLLAIPSVVVGFMFIQPMLFGDFFKDVIFVDAAKHPAMAKLGEIFHGPVAMALHGLQTAPFWLALAGVALSYYMYMVNPALPAGIKARVQPLYRLLENKYYLDWINENILAKGARALGVGLWKVGDQAIIDGGVVNGSWKLVGAISGVVRWVQSGFIFHYALVMILGVFALMTWFVWGDFFMQLIK